MPFSALFQPNPIGRRESSYLDWVRILSAQAVVIGHYGSWVGGDDTLLGGRVPIQDLGVVVFFILSGYLIASTLNNKLAADPGYGFSDFFIDRFSRIYVTFVPALLLVLGLDAYSAAHGNYLHAAAFNAYQFVGNLLMLQDFPLFSILRRIASGAGPWLVTSFGSARPFWTLAVEWWLYMFFGWFVLVHLRGSARSWRDGLVLAGLAFVPVMHATVSRGAGLTLFWALGALAAVALANVSQTLIGRRRLVAIAAGALVFAVARFAVARQFYDLQGVVFVAIAFVAGLYLARSGGGSAPRRETGGSGDAVSVLAGAAFALYAVHYSVMEFALAVFPAVPRLNLAVVAFFASQALAVAIYLVFDRRHRTVARALKARWTPLAA